MRGGVIGVKIHSQAYLTRPGRFLSFLAFLAFFKLKLHSNFEPHFGNFDSKSRLNSKMELLIKNVHLSTLIVGQET